MQITAESHLAPLLAPLGANADGFPVGESLEDDNDYLVLDEEMMKIGSLQHGQVEWGTAEELAIRMLSERGKDIKVLGHLLYCMQHDGSSVRFALSLRLLARSIAQPWWEHAYPFGGKRGDKLRLRLLQQFIQRSVKLVSGLDFHNAEDEFEACQASLAELKKQVTETSLPGKAIEDLSRQLTAQRSVEQSSSAPENLTPQQVGEQTSASQGYEAPATAKAPELRLEAGNDRSNRQALLKMAEFLGEQSPGEQVSYRLRRYAVWSTIQTLPVAKENGKTELSPVSADRIADYRESLSKGGDNALWQRIENSLALSPYWLEGHRLSAELAKQLGYSCCAEAIREETLRFVERLPGIESLTFNNGAAFLEEETMRWLHGSAGNSGAVSNGNEAWEAGLEEAREAVKGGDLSAALKVLDQGLSRACSPRESVYWRLASAELLHEAGLESLAQQHYHTLYQTVTDLALGHWEPALVSRLKAAVQETH